MNHRCTATIGSWLTWLRKRLSFPCKARIHAVFSYSYQNVPKSLYTALNVIFRKFPGEKRAPDSDMSKGLRPRGEKTKPHATYNSPQNLMQLEGLSALFSVINVRHSIMIFGCSASNWGRYVLYVTRYHRHIGQAFNCPFDRLRWLQIIADCYQTCRERNLIRRLFISSISTWSLAFAAILDAS